ncbi:MAG: hypothetical protein ACU0FH_20475 [Heliomarina sp.]|uniref:hypothetical protein n=1 Tax=Heliomarina sp. TaxID=2917556 RepID=UPI004058BDF4
MTLIDIHAEGGTRLADAASFHAADFIREHGLGLYDLFEILDDPVGQEATLGLVRESDKGLPDGRIIAGDMRTVRSVLEGIPHLSLDRLAAEGKASFDIYNAIRWYGARVSDLCARLG